MVVYDEVNSFELGPIRPPSEAYSLLIRVTRNCPWNRCRFCHTYKGAKFELRSVEDIKRDILAAKAAHDRIRALAAQHGAPIPQVAAMVFNQPPDDAHRNVALWLYAGGKSAFLQDANSLIMRTPELVEVITFLKQTFPSIERITTYARSHTAARKTAAELAVLREAGLSRIHIGLESGYDPLLEYIEKGVTAAQHIAGGRKVVASGISLSEYVILGLGGRAMWQEHAVETARVLNQIGPDFIRVRTLSVNPRMPLCADVDSGRFVRETDEEIIEEERRFIEHLDCHAHFVSDHITNLLQEIEGDLPADKPRPPAVIARFQAMPAEARGEFRLGRRLGIYERLSDLEDSGRREAMTRAMAELGVKGEVDEALIRDLMRRFI